MNLLVGCPVSHREWILPTWLEHLQRSCDDAEIGLDLLCLVASDDQECIDILDTAGAELIIVPPEDRNDVRSWNSTRYRHMVTIRNLLLNEVRRRAPFYFLSLDSDILLAPNAVSAMFNVFESHPDAWAVGSKCYLSNAGTTHPNMAMWTVGRSTRRFVRHDVEKVLPVDVLMAIKMMTPKAYAIDYDEHRFGEDFGWSKNALDLNAKFYWDGSVTSKHVMRRDQLNQVDVRVGF